MADAVLEARKVGRQILLDFVHSVRRLHGAVHKEITSEFLRRRTLAGSIMSLPLAAKEKYTEADAALYQAESRFALYSEVLERIKNEDDMYTFLQALKKLSSDVHDCTFDRLMATNGERPDYFTVFSLMRGFEGPELVKAGTFRLRYFPSEFDFVVKKADKSYNIFNIIVPSTGVQIGTWKASYKCLEAGEIVAEEDAMPLLTANPVKRMRDKYNVSSVDLRMFAFGADIEGDASAHFANALARANFELGSFCAACHQGVKLPGEEKLVAVPFEKFGKGAFEFALFSLADAGRIKLMETAGFAFTASQKDFFMQVEITPPRVIVFKDKSPESFDITDEMR